MVRSIVIALLTVACTLTTPIALSAQPSRTTVTVREAAGDLGNGHFRNPVLVGSYGDVSVVRDGLDYYATFGMKLVIWHSRDLVNWSRVVEPDLKGLGSPWAPDLVHHKGKWYIYTTLVDRNRQPGFRFMNVVLTADHPRGPWSSPVNLGRYDPIDPGHVVGPDGQRWLHYSAGRVFPLSQSGTNISGPIPARYSNYAGWKYPDEWAVECFCLEAPKFLFKDGWYHMLTAQGGTAGPPTAHMVVSARSRSPIGPWENSPHNPLVRTSNANQRFWRQGHGQLIDDIEGNWWLLYTGYNSKIGHKKLLLLMPITWDKDGWPTIKPDTDIKAALPKPAGTAVQHDGIAVFFEPEN